MANVTPGTSPSPSRRSREIRTLKEFASEGYGIQGFGRKICCVDTVDLSRIPSPFADLGDRAERLLHIVDLHAYEWVRRLFHNMYGKNTARLIDRLEGRPPGCPPGAFGFYQHETKINTGTPYLFFMRPDLPKTPLPLKKDNETTANISLDFRVLKNAKSDEMDYFVVNEKKDVFIINEKMIGKKLAAGPLPDFAVILVGCYVVFWWRTQAALDYMPEAVSQVSSVQIQRLIVLLTYCIRVQRKWKKGAQQRSHHLLLPTAKKEKMLLKSHQLSLQLPRKEVILPRSHQLSKKLPKSEVILLRTNHLPRRVVAREERLLMSHRGRHQPGKKSYTRVLRLIVEIRSQPVTALQITKSPHSQA